MNRLGGLAFRYMNFNKKRTLTTLVGIMLSAMLVYLVCGGGYSVYYNQNYDRYEQTLCWDAVYLCDGETAKELLGLASESGGSGEYNVRNAWIMQDAEQDGMSLPWSYVSDFGAMPEQIHLISGVLPKNENEIIVSHSASLSEKLTVGDIYGETKRVCGIFPDTYDTAYNNDELPYWSDILTLMPDDAFADEEIPVFVRFDKLSSLEKKSEELADAFGIDKFRISEAALACTKGLSNNLAFQFMLLLLGFLVECFTLFIIRNAFNISIHERSYDYGILRCIGMSRRQIIRLILTEAFFLALVGSLLGVLLGHLLGIGLFGLVKQILFVSVTLKMRFYRQAVIVTILLVFLGTAYAMVAPIEKLYRLNPIAAMNRSDSNKKKIRKIKSNQGNLLTKIFGFEVGYAYKTTRRSKGRFLTSVATLSLGVVLYVAVNNSFQMSLAPFQKQLHIQSLRELEIPETDYNGVLKRKQDILKMEEVKNAEIYTTDLMYHIERLDGEQKVVHKELYIGLGQKSYELFKKKDSETVTIYGVEGIPVTTEEVVDTLSDRIPIQLEWTGKNTDIYVYSLDENLASINIGKYLDLYMNKEINAVWMGYVIVAELDLSKNLDRFDRYCVENGLYFDEEEEVVNMQIIRGFVIVLNCILVVLMIIFIINLVNVECSQMMLRRKELEILRIIGIQKKQLSKVLYSESLIISVTAWLAGSILGFLLCLGWYLLNKYVVLDPVMFVFKPWSILLPGIILIIASILTVMIAREEE